MDEKIKEWLRKYFIWVLILYFLIFFIPMCTPLFKHNYTFTMYNDNNNCQSLDLKNWCYSFAVNKTCRNVEIKLDGYDNCYCLSEWCWG